MASRSKTLCTFFFEIWGKNRGWPNSASQISSAPGASWRASSGHCWWAKQPDLRLGGGNARGQLMFLDFTDLGWLGVTWGGNSRRNSLFFCSWIKRPRSQLLANLWHKWMVKPGAKIHGWRDKTKWATSDDVVPVLRLWKLRPRRKARAKSRCRRRRDWYRLIFVPLPKHNIFISMVHRHAQTIYTYIIDNTWIFELYDIFFFFF